MADRWFIHKDGQTLGPFEAAEIRDAMRQGSIDPFDLVSRENSSVRRELVEVDEIFFTSKIIFHESKAAGSGLNSGTGGSQSGSRSSGSSSYIRLDDNTQASHASKAMPGELQQMGRGVLALADQKSGDPDVSDSANNNAAATATKVASSPSGQLAKGRRDAKRYHLSDDNGRVMGPVSASEIQALYFKGVLSPSVKVLKDGSKSKVPVARFVAAYADAKKARSGGMQQGAHPMMPGGLQATRPAPMAFKRQRGFTSFVAIGRDRNPSLTLIAVMLAALLVGGFAAWILVSSGNLSSSRSDQSKDAASKRKAVAAEIMRQEKQRRRRLAAEIAKKTGSGPLARPGAKQPVEAAPSKVSPTVKNTRKPAQPQAAGKLAKPARKAVKAPKKTTTNKPKKAPVVKRQKLAVFAPPPRRATPVQPVRVPPPVVRPSPRPVPIPQAAAPAVKTTKPPLAALATGQAVKGLGPLSFDRSAVQACEGACKILFTGASGRVRVSFFKGVWGAALLSKSGGVSISGVVIANDGTIPTILLQDVH